MDKKTRDGSKLAIWRYGGVRRVAFAWMAMASCACGASNHAFADGGNSADGGLVGADDGGEPGADGAGGLDALGGSRDASIVTSQGTGTAKGTYAGPGCTGSGCSFPVLGAPACASSAPAISIVYPGDGVLVPPNMGVLSIQWTPFGSSYTTFEVDFSNSVTDVRVTTTCATQTVDTSQPPQPSGGCDLELPAAAWTGLANANRGNGPVSITVRGTTDGTCATKSQAVALSFAQEDLVGAIYYWKSTITSNGTGGQIWAKRFGDGTPENQITGGAGSGLSSACNGCHVLSRDGQRMVVYSNDDDSDDQYNAMGGSTVDLTTNKVIGGAAMQPPGFSTISPGHGSYLSTAGCGAGSCLIPTITPANAFSLWDGNSGGQSSTVTLGASGDRPTMPDWSPDGTNVVYVLPQKVAVWDRTAGGLFGGGSSRNDDDHEFGGSLYALPYRGGGSFGAPSPILLSQGENNYYPSYSPDGRYIVFDRAPASTKVTSIDACTNAGQPGATCPNDSFSNPDARLMLLATAKNATPVDLENANGSTASAPQPLSNSWPRWAPFVQNYRGGRLLWVAFSSTRDYGVLVRNHLTGMYQCYPPDSYMNPGDPPHSVFDAACQQPKLWMSAVVWTSTQAPSADPSRPAFYLPFQDVKTHNHTPQWAQQLVGSGAPASSACIAGSGACEANPGGCCSPNVCSGEGVCAQVVP